MGVRGGGNNAMIDFKTRIIYSVMYSRDTYDGNVWVCMLTESPLPIRHSRRNYALDTHYRTRDYWNSDPEYIDKGFGR